MPVKAKTHSQTVYMGKEMTHHHLTHIEKHNWHINNWQKVLIALGIILVIAVIIMILALEA